MLARLELVEALAKAGRKSQAQAGLGVLARPPPGARRPDPQPPPAFLERYADANLALAEQMWARIGSCAAHPLPDDPVSRIMGKLPHP